MNKRIQALLSAGDEGGVYVLHKPENVRHFSGFTGEGMLVLGKDLHCIVTDFRYEEQAGTQSKGFDVVLIDQANTHAQHIARLAQGHGGKLYAELDFITVEQWEELKKALCDLAIYPMKALPEELRMIKTQSELTAMQKAASITDETFSWILQHVCVGMSERTLALDMYVHMKKLGADGIAFPSIVASGPNGSLPHAEPSERKIQSGDLLTLDFGATYGGYCSDFTRTISFGTVDSELRKIYDIVLTAQLRALDVLAAGKTGREVDAVARRVISDAGYGERFGHGLGHGVGRLVHENPRLSMKGDTVLLSGMMVTVEPGIYLPGVGGVRIEDLCYLTKDGHINLCTSTKEFITI